MSRFFPGAEALDKKVIYILGLTHLVWSLFINPHGYLTWDSGSYLMMLRAFASTGSFLIENGPLASNSPEWAVGQLQWVGGGLVSQYPEFFTLICYPVYQLCGWTGVFIQNAILYLGVCSLIWNISWRLAPELVQARVSVLLYVFGSFSWEYSQSEYPHMAATFWVTLGAFLSLCAIRSDNGGAECIMGFLAGLSVGVAVGVRLDSIFAVPILFIPPMLVPLIRYRAILSSAVGVILPLLLLGWINLVKFQAFNPFAYGVNRTGNIRFSIYLPMLAVAIIGFAVIFIAVRKPGFRSYIYYGALFITLGLFVSPLSKEMILRMLDGLWQIAVDMRVRSLDILEPALSRTDSGGMVYLGACKKALLQSSPWLAMVVLWFLMAFRRPEEKWRCFWLLLVPVSFLVPFSWLAWHGSVACNMRYLNPALPFLAIAGSFAIQEICPNLLSGRKLRYTVYFLALVVLICHFLPIGMAEQIHLTFPIVLAVVMMGLSLVCLRIKSVSHKMASLASLVLTMCIVWSGCIAFLNDYVRSAWSRNHNVKMAMEIAPFIPEHSVIVTLYPDAAWALLEWRIDLALLYPAVDDFKSFQNALKVSQDEEYRIFFLLSEHDMKEVASGYSLETETIYELGTEAFSLYRLKSVVQHLP